MTIGPYRITAIDDETWRIEEGFVRAYLLAGAERALLIDSGNGGGDILDAIRRCTAKPVTLVNTHADPDHIGCNHLFPTALMHPAEFAYYRGTAKPGDAAPLPLWDGEVLDLGGRHVQAVLLPGHTPGTLALIDLAHGYLFSSDNLTSGSVFLFGPWRDLRAYAASMERLSLLSNKYKRVFPSHGDPELGKDQPERQLACARAVLEGRAAAEDAPSGIPARRYVFAGASVYYVE